ncbi:MAG: hypothetical protein EHM23_01645 [Acidobacteria bacterium]|nr:MAG: hypothetical protein EHM23_06680 [Acidobacteriota bacterium]RPJ63594.1 MAG: hypothetical protein EHM23_01645 [Acidobacteriota bacterium]
MEHSKYLRILALGLAVVGLAHWYWSGRKTEEHFLPSGSPLAESIQFEYAVYYLPAPSSDPAAVLRRVLKDQQLSIKEKGFSATIHSRSPICNQDRS